MNAKTLTLLSAVTIVMLSGFRGHAQHLVASTEVEKTVAGLHYGASLSIEFKRKISIGGFYQCGLQQFEGKVTPVRTFYALQIQFPLFTCDKVAVLANTRTGFVNDQFFVIVPALVTTVQVSPLLSVSFGSGLRMQNASLLAKINLTL